MKKTYYLGLAALVGLSLATPLAVSAVETTTSGEAGFNTDTDNIPVVKPGTDEDIKPDKPLPNQPVVDGVKLTYAPDFNFGTNAITLASGTQEYAVHNDLFAYTATPTQKVEIPQFVQVADASGKLGTKWDVTLQQLDAFKVSGTGASAGTALSGSRIRLYGQTVTNNLRTPADVIQGLTIDTTKGYSEVPVKTATGENPISVLKSTAVAPITVANSTNGSKSSIVFAKDYDEADYKTPSTATSIVTRKKNEAVKLAVPQSDTVLAENYSATLNWTLTVTP